MACSDIVTFRGGFISDWALVSRLLDIEERGALFRLEPQGRFRVVPPSVLTPDDVQILRCRRDEVRTIIEYIDRMAELPL